MIINMKKKLAAKAIRARYLIIMASLMMAVACNYIDFRSDSLLLAKAYNSRLYLEDIKHLIPPGSNPADSALFVKRYVDNWLINQVFLYHAMKEVELDELGLEQRVRDYKHTLIMHSFESLLIREAMDTVISDEEILEYYESNKAYFTLKEHIVNATYIKLPLRAAETNRIRSRYRSSDPEVLEELEELCLQSAATYYIGHDTWMLFSNIIGDMPLRMTDPGTFLSDNRFTEITDDYYRYFLYIHDYRLKGDVSPLALERENIKGFIHNKRKRQFIQEQRHDLFRQAIEANRVVTYL